MEDISLVCVMYSSMATKAIHCRMLVINAGKCLKAPTKPLLCDLYVPYTKKGNSTLSHGGDAFHKLYIMRDDVSPKRYQKQ